MTTTSPTAVWVVTVRGYTGTEEEETDYYPAGGWRAPTRPHLIQTPRQHRGAAGNAGTRSAR